ncbi:hypothetical protein Sjap_010476 [Stephania japonica]|uniref:Uncharacterized protein n=1 Tax=Stephania japonica TaxID=461633 RepID=A0AAP0J9H1_9MAGN
MTSTFAATAITTKPMSSPRTKKARSEHYLESSTTNNILLLLNPPSPRPHFSKPSTSSDPIKSPTLLQLGTLQLQLSSLHSHRTFLQLLAHPHNLNATRDHLKSYGEGFKIASEDEYVILGPRRRHRQGMTHYIIVTTEDGDEPSWCKIDTHWLRRHRGAVGFRNPWCHPKLGPERLFFGILGRCFGDTVEENDHGGMVTATLR